jgi:hypothetical protein
MTDNNINYGQQQPVQPQPQWQPGMPVPPQMPNQKQKKPFFKRTWVIVTGAVLGVFIIIGIASSGGSTPTNTAGSAVPSGGVTSSDQPADDKLSEKPKESAKPSEQPKPAAKKWVKLVTLTGTADKQSDTIKTTGGKVRITFTFKNTASIGGIGAIYFLDEGTDLQNDGGIPEVMVTEPGKDVTTLRKDAGEYFLKISSANFKYSVAVEEER